MFLVGFWSFYLGKSCFGTKKVVTEVIPKIVTVFDTVPTRPSWLDDSIKAWKKRSIVHDTVPLIISQTIIDTQLVNVGADTTQRPKIWPVLDVTAGARFSDTTLVRTFSLRDGRESFSKLFTTGYIKEIHVDESRGPTPLIIFAPFPPREQHNWFYPIKNFLFGFGTGSGLGLLSCVVK
jgi:hypothetical protein